MQIDYIRRDVNEAISEDGGAYIQLVNKLTVGLADSIREAKDQLFNVGDESLIESNFVGLSRSVFEGIKADGHPRTVGDITFFPVCGGAFDLDKGWDPAVNDVRIKARLINGVTLDITNWTFRDVTPGRVAFSIDSVSDGTTAGVVRTKADVQINGRNFPAQEDLAITWVCGNCSGTVGTSHYTSNVSRITIDKAAFENLSAAQNGEPITFTVKGCFNKATKTATYVYDGPQITGVKQDDLADGHLKFLGNTVTISGSGLRLELEDSLKIEMYSGETLEATNNIIGNVTTSSDTSIVLSSIPNTSGKDASYWENRDSVLVLTKNNVRYTYTVHFDPSV